LQLFVQAPEENGDGDLNGDVDLDEYDVSSGKKLRTISFGAARDGSTFVSSILSNDKELFCMVGGDILSFLL